MAQRTSAFVIDMPSTVESVAAPVPARAAWLEEALSYGMLVMVVFAPLAFGATQPWSQFVQRAVALGLLALWAIGQWLRGSMEFAANSVYLPSLAFAGLVFLQFGSGLTAYRYATLTEGLNLIPYGVLILLGGELFVRRQQLRKFCIAMAVFGFALALFALVQDFSNSTRIYWIVKVRSVSAAIYGPYANHNHYAGLMEMLIPLAVAAAFLERGAKRGLLMFCTIIMAVSVVFSRSRGGMLALALALIFACSVLYRSYRDHRAALTLLSLSAAIPALALFLGNDKILRRLAETQDQYRLLIWSDSLRMWLHRPLLGFGWGTFSTVYPEYRSFFTNLFVNHAHNDYLELLVETGVVGVAITGWFLFVVLRRGFRKMFDRADREGRVLTLGAITAVVAMLAHSTLDFNLHIPANAALFFLLCSAIATPFKRAVRPFSFHSSAEMEEKDFVMDGNA